LLLSAKGDPAGTGDGGVVELGFITDLTTSDISVAGGAGPSSNAKGGTINIHDSSTITVGASKFDASAQGTGDGGSITINTAGTKIDISQATINAKADVNGTGKGGKVEVAYAKGAPGQPLSVNTIIKVDGSDSLSAAAESDFGRIKINSTTCQQRTTHLAPWPKTYWNCQHLYASTVADKRLYAGASKLHGTNQSALDTAKIQIYIMRDPIAFQDYHGVGPANTLGIFGYSYEALRVSAVFFQLLTAGAPDTSANAYYSGTVIHEMSHQLNYWSWGHVDSTGPTWLGHLNTATLNFDAPGMPPPAVNNCSVVVDADRTANGRSAIGLFKEKPVDVVHHLCGDFYKWHKPFSPYTSLSELAEISLKYGKQFKLIADLEKLEQAIQSGEITGVQLIKHEEVLEMIRNSPCHEFSRRNAMKYAIKDKEILIRGVLPKRFFKVELSE
jgi:hypothetical protein